MGFKTGILLAVAAAGGATAADASVMVMEFTVASGGWNHLNGVTGPYGLPLQPTLSGSIKYEDTRSDVSAFLSLDYVTGSRTWSIADIQSGSAIYYFPQINAPLAIFLNLGGGNAFGSNNTAVVAEGPNTLYCNDCVNVTYVGAPRLAPPSPTPPMPVPEPGTWALLLAGFGAMGSMIRVRRRQPA